MSRLLTHWNSIPGKPGFKTIGGQSIFGSGDIAVSDSSKVPYTGATQGLNMGLYDIQATKLIASNPSGLGPSPYLSAVNSFSEATLELRNSLTNGYTGLNLGSLVASGSISAGSLTASGKIRSDAALVSSIGTQGANGPSLEMGFANYGFGVNANGEPVTIINSTVRNRLGVDIVVSSAGCFGFGNSANAGLNSTVDTKITRYGPQVISMSNASGTSGFVARADNGRILVGYDAGGDYIAAGNSLGSSVPLYVGSSAHSMIRFNSVSERMRIVGSTGNVLIGTTTDDGSSRLQVSGNINASGNITTGYVVSTPNQSSVAGTLLGSNGNGPWIRGSGASYTVSRTNSQTSASLYFYSFGNETVQVYGRLGIGGIIQAPQSFLTAASNTLSLWQSDGTTPGSLNLANLTASGTTTLGTTVGTNPLVVSCGVWGWLNIGSTTGPTRAIIQTSSSSTGIEISAAGTAPVYLQNAASGRVLVGTTTDDGVNRLQVSGGIAASGTVTSAFRSISADPTTLDVGSGLSQLVKNTTSGEIRLWVNDGGTMKKSAALT